MTDVQVLEKFEDHEVLVPLGRSEAEKLDGRIRRLARQAGDQLVQVGRLLDEARSGRIHEALGLPSWTAYVADAVGGQLQLSGDARQAMVALMSGEGMSVRAIAAATGVSKSTVDRDLAQVSHDGTVDADSTVPQRDSSQDAESEAPVVEGMGLDGKVRRRQPRKPRAKREPAPVVEPEPEPAPEPVSMRKIQIPTAFRAEAKMLVLIVDVMGALATDPRWDKAAGRFTDEDRAALDANIETLQAVRAAMASSPAVGEQVSST